jgi:hypothetical protein
LSYEISFSILGDILKKGKDMPKTFNVKLASKLISYSPHMGRASQPASKIRGMAGFPPFDNTAA